MQTSFFTDKLCWLENLAAALPMKRTKKKKKGKATRVEELVSTRGMSTGVGRESIVVDRKHVEIP